ncbi:MAG: tetratricopeptide repeat protein [Saprospiraceae bacterium]|mgnify:CR=1 FL=1|jgi:tetratricopeptide (TPR) repeat protein|tara:strand:+ start:288 stop:1424 length:1137 start_codon:yes stop_codon:yes gene_type:complete
MKYTKLYILIAGLFFSMSLFAQNLEDEVEFLYMKAKYLYDTDRHEDAVNAFNKVIQKDANHQDALVLRGASKFSLAAYQGAIKDFNKSIEERGVTKDVVGWIALAHYKMNNMDLAVNTLETALLVDPKNRTLWNLQGDIAQDNDERLKACDSWEKAAALGDTKAKRKLEKNCDGSSKSKRDRISKTDSKKANFNQEDPNKSKKDDGILDDDEVISLGDREEDVILKDDKYEDNDTPVREEMDEETEDQLEEEEVLSLGDKEEEEDTTEEKPDRDPNEKAIIEIDEIIALEIYGEYLGSRKILDQPNILMLPEEDGIVAVNVCVGSKGRVKTAEYNDELSTIKTQSLISFAIRKAKEFWFAKDRNKEACGVILYKITGS